MADQDAKRDANKTPSLLGVRNDTGEMIRVVTNSAGELIVASGSGGGLLGLTDNQLRASPVPVSTSIRQKTHVEFIPSSAAPTTIYKGYAAPGTADATAAWTIQRFVFTGTTAIDETWTGTTAIWNNRTSETFT